MVKLNKKIGYVLLKDPSIELNRLEKYGITNPLKLSDNFYSFKPGKMDLPSWKK